jgi:hypothetical protein
MKIVRLGRAIFVIGHAVRTFDPRMDIIIKSVQ